MRVLRSRRVGGSFFYAPALPFMEALLPSDYLVERVAVPDELAGRLPLAAEGLDGAPGYATRVMRLRRGNLFEAGADGC